MDPARPAPLRSAVFEAWQAPARRWPGVWRLVPGFYMILLVYMICFAPILTGLILWHGGDAVMGQLRRMMAPTEPGPTLLLLATFIGLALGAVAAAGFVHQRGPATLIGRAPVVVRDFLRAALVVAGVYAVLTLPWALRWDALPNLDPGTWLALLPLALAGVLIQTLAEELVFRGYLMQQLAARFRSPLIWLVLPAALFGSAHYAPQTNGVNTWVVIGAITAFGLAAGDLTRRTGSLGAAWGMHFANNVLALVVLGQSGAIQGLALWVTPYSAADASLAPVLIGDLIAIGAVWLILTRILRR
jgi:membrane protease YdiL (CAAX protease family)